MSLTVKLPLWLRIINILAGILYIILSFLVLIDIGFATFTLLIILAVSLMLIGLSRIVNGIFIPKQRLFLRILKIIVGILLLPLALIVITYPALGIDVLIILLAGGLIANGVLRIIIASADVNIPNWFRVLLFILGILTILLGIIVIISFDYGMLVLILLLALSFIFAGVARIMYGVVGFKVAD